MTEKITVTSEPSQITDGTNSAHITVQAGSILYADAADSAEWHELRNRELNVNAPVKIYVKVWAGEDAEIIVTTWAA